MSYVLSVVTQLGNSGEVYIKARGQSISKAVDVAEIVRNRFVQDAVVTRIAIGTDVIGGNDKEKINVSTIELVLTKQTGSA